MASGASGRMEFAMRRNISSFYPPLALLLLTSCASLPTDTVTVCKTDGKVPVSTWENVSISEANEILSSIGGEGSNELLLAMRHGVLIVDSERPIRLQRGTDTTEISFPNPSEVRNRKTFWTSGKGDFSPWPICGQ